MTPLRSQRLDRLPPYLFAEMERKRAALQAQGRDVINLGIGDPDQPPPRALREALARRLDDAGIHQYSPSQGSEAFRRAAAGFLERRAGVRLDPAREILMGIGSKELIGHLPLALTNPGDVVLVPEPGYPPYRSGTIFALCEPFVLPLLPERGFLPDLGAIPADVARRAKVLYVNYPNNPTGAVAPRGFYEEVVAFSREHDILAVADMAYAELYFEQRPASFLEVPGARDVGIEVHSFTKTFNMAGWRLAWAAGRADVLEALRSLKANLDSGQFLALQAAAAEMLERGEEEAAAIRAMYRRRRDAFVGPLRKAGWSVPLPDATFYVWFRVPTGEPSFAFAERAMEKAGVVVTPGAGFGRHGEGYVRIALTVPEDRCAEAADRLVRLCA